MPMDRVVVINNAVAHNVNTIYAKVTVGNVMSVLPGKGLQRKQLRSVKTVDT
jgi:hypothetical protein